MHKSYLTGMLALLFAFSGMFLASCKHKEEQTPVTNTRVTLEFSHWVSGGLLQMDTMIYSTPPGNAYKVTDLQYFVSDVCFVRNDGKRVYVTDNDSIHYADLRIPSTLVWPLNTKFPGGSYDSIEFVFGLNARRNRSYRFPDPPERDMFWPEVLGGGYHYMKMNLVWKNDTMVVPWPFNLHLGIGQLYSHSGSVVDSVIGFVQNIFAVAIPLQSLETGSSAEHVLDLRMNIEKWFYSDQMFDFADFPEGTMQNETAMQEACANGRHAFEIRIIK